MNCVYAVETFLISRPPNFNPGTLQPSRPAYPGGKKDKKQAKKDKKGKKGGAGGNWKQLFSIIDQVALSRDCF
jgi:hypothetical protein